MSDEKPVPETLESIAQQIRELTAWMTNRFDGVDARFVSIDKRFDGVDKRFDGVDKRFDGVDKRFDELKAQLRTEIESVRADVQVIAEGFATKTMRDQRHVVEHARLSARIDRHRLRIAALEKKSEKKDSA